MRAQGTFTVTVTLAFRSICAGDYEYRHTGLSVEMPAEDTVLSAGSTAVSYPPNALYVRQLYQDLLHRPAETTGQNYWSQMLANGSSQDAVVSGIMGSSEYRKERDR